MAMSTVRGGHSPARRLKSPLAVPGAFAGSSADNFGSPAPAPGRVALTDREATLAEFQGYLRDREQPGRAAFRGEDDHSLLRPGEKPRQVDDRQGDRRGLRGGGHGPAEQVLPGVLPGARQGGTHTLQRNLIQLFGFLERERGCTSPYTDGLNRYAAVKGRPKTLSGEFIDDLLEVTGGGRARDFETAVITSSSGSCAARASGGWNCSAWSSTRCPRT